MAEDPNALTNRSFRITAGNSMWRPNIANGGQYGFGNHLKRLDAATPLVMMSAVPIITHIPTVFRLIPDWPQFLKDIIELMTIAIDGIDIEYNIDTGQIPAGANGQQYRVPIKNTLNEISPSFRIPEFIGNCVWSFFTNWMQLMVNPETQASTLAGVIQPTQYIKPLVGSAYSMDMLILQYDTTMQPENLIDAYFIMNMFPTNAGGAGYHKELGENQVLERNIQMTGIIQRNQNTRAVGVNIARLLKLKNIDFNFAQPIALNIESGIQDMGLQAQAAQDQTEFTPLVWGGNAAYPPGGSLGGVNISSI